MAMGDADTDFAKLCSELENQELESPNCMATPQAYSQLLALYLLQKDLTNAKFLWKRIPTSVKNGNTELSLVWAVGQKMWQRDFPGVYEALKKDWNNGLRPIMDAVLEATRKRAFDLVAHAYSCISAENFSLLMGMPPADAINGIEAESSTIDAIGFILPARGTHPKNLAIRAATSQGWTFDQQTRMITPVLPEKPVEAMIPSEKQLAQLTEFVSFLEN